MWPTVAARVPECVGFPSASRRNHRHFAESACFPSRIEAFIAGAVKLTTAIRRFETQLRADGKSPHTREVYLRDLRSLAFWLGKDVKISSLTPHTLARYLSSESFTQTASGKHKAAISLNRSKSALRSFFRFLTDAGLLKANPARLIRSARLRKTTPRVKSAHQVLFF